MPKRTRSNLALNMDRACWLMKSEPDVFSIDDLKAKKTSPWDGVRNYQARNFMKQMAVGDPVLFYHSNAKPPGVAGLARVCKLAYPDHTARDKTSPYHDERATEEKPIWEMVDVEFIERFNELLSLDTLRQEPALKDMVLFNRSRLSVQPVTPEQYRHIVSMGAT
jgi:predicted RNA-binding protein with PUA-like domain